MPGSPSPSPGPLFGGYRLLARLGTGGLGTVFKAIDERGTPRAIKLIDARAHPAGAQRLRQEGAALGMVDHPNVVRVVAAGEEPPFAYLVLEFVSGVSLSSCLLGGKRLLVREACGLADQVLQALEALHARGIVHRDVKPGNILVARAEDVPGAGGNSLPFVAKLSDFGLARFGKGDPEEGVVGTPAYMAPEQWQHPDAVDGRADLYAVGCTLFQMLCGCPPFEPEGGHGVVELMRQHNEAPRPDPASFRADVGERLAGVVRRMLAVAPENRYPSATAARAALEEAARRTGPTTTHGEPLFLPAERGRGETVPAEVAAAEASDSVEPASGRDGSPGTAEHPAAPAVPASVSTAENVPAAPRLRFATRVGNYELQQVLWHDFASTMYQARDTLLDVEVAVEVLRETPDGADLVERFRRRARAGALVNHPNVQRVFALQQVGEDSEAIRDLSGRAVAFCVLEPLRGRTLRARIDGPLPLDEALPITEQILLGLHAIHGHGLVHRDLKPANVFLQDLPPVPIQGNDAGRGQPSWALPWIVKLIGFHLVRDIEAGGDEPLTHHGSVMGTPAYMAPEQARGEETDLRADLYALGCVVFEMVCGRHVFPAGTPMEFLLAHRDQPAPDPAAVRPDLPAALAALIRRLLAKRPEDRYQTAAQVLEALEEARAARDQPRAAEPRREGGPPAAEAPAVERLDMLLRLDDQAYSSDLVVTHYPAPIALAYRRFARQAEPRARLERLFYVVEAGLRYLVTLGLCDLLHCLAAAAPDRLTLPEHEAFDFLRRPVPMQLGLWLSALRETAGALARQPGRFVTELPDVCAPGGRLDGVLGRLIAHRNETAHAGGIPVTADECQAVGRAARPLLEDFLGAVRFVCAYPLGFVQCGLALDRPEGRHGYYLHSCMGTGVENIAQAYHVQTPSPLEEHVPFVAAGDGSRLL
jgi:serine/threonine-protein kinase